MKRKINRLLLIFTIFCMFSCEQENKDRNLEENILFEKAFLHAKQANEGGKQK